MKTPYKSLIWPILRTLPSLLLASASYCQKPDAPVPDRINPTASAQSKPIRSARVPAITVDLGANYPDGLFHATVYEGFSANAGLEIPIFRKLSLEAKIGGHKAQARESGDLAIFQFLLNGKVYIRNPDRRLRPFLNAGGGAYEFTRNSSALGVNFGTYKFSNETPYPGTNWGGGLLIRLNRNLGLQGSYNFYAVQTHPEVTKFSTLQGGIRISLQ